MRLQLHPLLHNALGPGGEERGNRRSAAAEADLGGALSSPKQGLEGETSTGVALSSGWDCLKSVEPALNGGSRVVGGAK